MGIFHWRGEKSILAPAGRAEIPGFSSSSRGVIPIDPPCCIPKFSIPFPQDPDSSPSFSQPPQPKDLLECRGDLSKENPNSALGSFPLFPSLTSSAAGKSLSNTPGNPKNPKIPSNTPRNPSTTARPSIPHFQPRIKVWERETTALFMLWEGSWENLG